MPLAFLLRIEKNGCDSASGGLRRCHGKRNQGTEHHDRAVSLVDSDAEMWERAVMEEEQRRSAD